jgi:uncharacterized membrane protein YkvA (DUF1232 family)
MLDEVCHGIEALELQRDAPDMLEEIRRARPDFATRLDEAMAALEAKGKSRAAAQVVALGIASFIISKVKEIPEIVQTMVAAANNRSTDPATRCAVLGALAYVVQPHDLIPDDAPGGYGFVDDAILLRTGMIEYLNLLPPNPTQDDLNRDVLQSFASLVPLAVLPALQQAVQGMTMAFQLLLALPPEVVEFTTQQILRNPLQMTAPQAPAGFRAPAYRDFSGSAGRGHWSGGAYFEGNNVIMPGGGPSLIDGQLFIPS